MCSPPVINDVPTWSRRRMDPLPARGSQSIRSIGLTSYAGSPPPHPSPGRSHGRSAAHALDRPHRTVSRERSAPTTDARVRTGGRAPRSRRSSAVRTLMQLTMATAPMVEPGPTGVSRPSIAHQRVGWRRAEVDDEVGLVEQPRSDDRVGLARTSIGRREVTAMTRMPRRRAPRAPSRRHGRQAAGREDDHHVVRPEREVRQDDLGEPGRPLDEHRLALAVRADDLGVERHRQLDHRVEARVRAVAREHLLDRDARVARPEQVDEAIGGDRVGAPAAGRLDAHRPGSRPAARGGPSPRGQPRRARARSWRIPRPWSSSIVARGAIALARGAGDRPGPPPALRARKSSRWSPSRWRRCGSRRASMTSSSASSVRTPPAALTPMCGDVLARIRMQVVVGRAARREAGARS